MDTVAQCLSAVKRQLDEVNAKYNITLTSPTNNLPHLDEDCLYVIRQRIDAGGVYHLVAAVQMGRAIAN